MEERRRALSSEPRTQHLRIALAFTIFLQTSVFDDRSVSTFLRDLQRSVARDDRPAVSALVQYPLTVFAGGVRIPIRDAAALLQNYDVVFSPALKTIDCSGGDTGPRTFGFCRFCRRHGRLRHHRRRCHPHGAGRRRDQNYEDYRAAGSARTGTCRRRQPRRRRCAAAG